MHPRSFLAGTLIAVVLALGATLYFTGNLTRDFPEKLLDAAHKITPFHQPESPAVPEGSPSERLDPAARGPASWTHIPPRTEAVVQTPAEVHTSYGLVHVDAGTRVLVIREERDGVLSEFAGKQVVLPLWIFHVPGQPLRSSRIAKLLQSASPAPAPASSPAPVPVAAVPALPAKAPATALDASAAPPRPDTGVQHFAKCLLVVDGDVGRGSASIILMNGVPTIVTNAHVMSGNPNVKFRRLTSKEVHAGKLSLSRDYDLARLTQSEIETGIEMMNDVDRNAGVGDEVVVLGNSQGSNVVTEIPGKILGIGPDLIEVDAKFVEGNSGSPIIHVKTGKVIGIATFALVRKISTLGKDSQFTEVRRFGYRLDTATKWEEPSPASFASEAEALKHLRENTDAVYALAIDIYKNGQVTPGLHYGGDNLLRNAVNQYLEVVDGKKRIAPIDYISAKQRLLRTAITVTSSDIQNFDVSKFTGYHRRVFEEEREGRKFLAKKFTEMLEAQDAGQRIRLP